MQRVVAPSHWIPVYVPDFILEEAGLDTEKPLQATIMDGKILLEQNDTVNPGMETVEMCDRTCYRCRMKDTCREGCE